MSTERSYFTLNLPRRPRDGDKIQVVAKLKNKPKVFRLLLGVKNVQAERQNAEPKLVAFEFKTVFNEKGEARVTSNWKTQNGWQDEKQIDETDWLDEQTGLFKLNLQFDRSNLKLFDDSNSLITRENLQYELNTLSRIQLWGDILKVKSISLKYDQPKNPRSSQIFDFILEFKGSTLLMKDEGASLITKFNLKYELSTIDSLHLFGDIIKLDSLSLKYAS